MHPFLPLVALSAGIDDLEPELLRFAVLNCPQKSDPEGFKSEDSARKITSWQSIGIMKGLGPEITSGTLVTIEKQRERREKQQTANSTQKAGDKDRKGQTPTPIHRSAAQKKRKEG
jgi:hypothetical protein